MAGKPTIACVLKLRPTCAQAATFNRWLWHLTGVYNWGIKTLENEPYLSAYDLKARLNGHSARLGIPTQVLRGTVKTAHEAWRRHRWLKIARRPRLRGRRRPLNSFLFSNGTTPIKNGRVALGGIGLVRLHRQEIPEGRISAARLLKRASGWYLYLFIKAEPRAIPRVASGQIGIDPGFKSLLTFSTGEKIEHPHEWATRSARLGQAQRGLRRRLVARIYERIKNQRRDRNHKLARRLVSENMLIAFSKDKTGQIARTFGKSVASAAHSDLLFKLRSKCLTGGTRLVEVSSRNSTKACSVCGSTKDGPSGFGTLQVRTWRCRCGAEHDRDVNAARNTLRSGLEQASENRSNPVSGIAS